MYSRQVKVPSVTCRLTGYTLIQVLYGADRISPRSYASAPARPSTPPSTAQISSTLCGTSLPLLQRPWRTSWPGSASTLQVRPTLPDTTLKAWPSLTGWQGGHDLIDTKDQRPTTAKRPLRCLNLPAVCKQAEIAENAFWLGSLD